MLTTSLRFPGERTDPAIHDQIKYGAAYTTAKEMGIVMDHDLRLARQQFLDRYPEEQQQVILLRAFPLQKSGSIQTTVLSPAYEDHYTFGRIGYKPLKSEVLGFYIYKKTAGLIPSSEIANGRIQYGSQQYLAVVFYKPEYDHKTVGDFFKKAGAAGATHLFRVGNLTIDFE